jgi:hypothetical protein
MKQYLRHILMVLPPLNQITSTLHYSLQIAANIGYYVVGGTVKDFGTPRGLLIATPDASSLMGEL